MYGIFSDSNTSVAMCQLVLVSIQLSLSVLRLVYETLCFVLDMFLLFVGICTVSSSFVRYVGHREIVGDTQV